jgi:excisionase family DNA binding protein
VTSTDIRSLDMKQTIRATLTEPLWTVADVAEYLRLKPETVRMKARAKTLPAIKVGRVWRFRPDEIKGQL